MQVKDVDILKAIILKEAETETLPQGFEDDPMGFILKKYPGLNEVMTYLMTKDFKEFVDAIFVVAPKPTTFKILLHNGQFLFLQFMGKTYQATVSGKNYYLMTIGEKERCMLAIARLLRYGNPLKTKGPEGAEQGTRPEGEEGGAGGEAGAEVPEATPEEGGEELKEAMILSEILKNSLVQEDEVDDKKQVNKKVDEPEDKKVEIKTHDELIKKELGVEQIPVPKTKVELGNNFTITDKEDKEIWKKLYTVSPSSKKGLATKTSGYGEVAVAWLFSGNGNTVEDSTGSDNPDLKINGTGVEVKAYGKDRITLGKFSKDHDSVHILNTIFGLNSLLTVMSKEKKQIPYNANNFTPDALADAVDKFTKIDSNEELRKLEIDFIKSIFEKIDEVKKDLDLKGDYKKEDLANKVIKKLLTNKLKYKPGIGGYILDCTVDGKGDFTQISQNSIDSIDPEKLKDSVSVNSAQISVDFKKLFTSK